MELSELVILLHVKSGKKQTVEHFGALKIPTHSPTSLPPNQKENLPWEKICHLENGIFSKSYTDSNKRITSITKKPGGPKNHKSAVSSSVHSHCLKMALRSSI